MLIVRLKQCEVAMADGRLDEAFALACQPDLRAHRTGQALVGRLARELIRRGRQHLGAGQLVAAAEDCEKAAALAGNLPDITQLRAAVSNAMADQRRVNQLCNQVAAAVRHHADNGQISIGEQLLADAELPESQAQMIQRDLAARRASLKSAIEKATTLLKSGDWHGAVEQLARVDRGSRAEPAIRELCSKIIDKAMTEARQAIDSARLDLAGSVLARLQHLPGPCVEADHLRSCLEKCHAAMAEIERGDIPAAEQTLKTLLRLWPNARWLKEVQSHLSQLRSSMDELRASPLRLAEVIGLANRNGEPPPVAVGRIAKPVSGCSSPADFVLHVDGVGSFRVIGRPVVSIGPVSASKHVDVPLMADATLPVVTITRSDDDYFLQSTSVIAINDKPQSNRLLVNGDRIAIGPRCRITFRRPSPASATAILDLSGTRAARGDVRHVVLLDRELVVGPGPAAHVRCDDLRQPAVLQRRDAKMTCRAGDPILLDGRPVGNWAEIPAGTHVTIGPVGLVIAKEN